MKLLPIDFETYYDDEFSLGKMTTTMYVRDERFLVHGASVYLPEEQKAIWLSGEDGIAEFLEGYDPSETAVICHNTAFDGFILSQIFNFVPAYYYDTLSMSRAEFGLHVRHDLDSMSKRMGGKGKQQGELAKTKGIRELSSELEESLAGYALQDIEETWFCFNKFINTLHYPRDELDIINLTIRAYADPRLVVDHDLAHEELQHEIDKKLNLMRQVKLDSKVLASNDMFAEELRKRGIEPPMKFSERQQKEIYAFAKNDLEFQELAKNPVAAPLVRARMAVKSTIGESRAQRLMDHSTGGALPIMMNYCLSRTHRWTGGDKMNPQNLPARGDSTRLRNSIQAPKGYRLIIVDSAQIEARMLAWLAGQDDVVQQFRDGIDTYVTMAEQIYQRPIDPEIDKRERFLGKTARLSLGYGSGVNKFSHTVRAGLMGPAMEIEDSEAMRIVRTYRTMNQNVVNLWDSATDVLINMVQGRTVTAAKGLIEATPTKHWMPHGLALHYPNMIGYPGEYDSFSEFTYMGPGGQQTKIYGAKLVENWVQCLARVVVSQQVLQIARAGFHIALLVHDEVVFLARESEADAALNFALDAFHKPPEWCADLPVAGTGSHSHCYIKD